MAFANSSGNTGIPAHFGADADLFDPGLGTDPGGFDADLDEDWLSHAANNADHFDAEIVAVTSSDAVDGPVDGADDPDDEVDGPVDGADAEVDTPMHSAESVDTDVTGDESIDADVAGPRLPGSSRENTKIVAARARTSVLNP